MAVVHGATFVSFFEATQRYKAPDVFTAPSVYWIIAEDQTSFCGYLRRDYIFFLDTVWAYQRSRRQWWLTFRGGSWHHWHYRAEWREVPLSLSGLSSYFHRASHGSTVFLTPTAFTAFTLPEITIDLGLPLVQSKTSGVNRQDTVHLGN